MLAPSSKTPLPVDLFDASASARRKVAVGTIVIAVAVAAITGSVWGTVAAVALTVIGVGYSVQRSLVAHENQVQSTLHRYRQEANHAQDCLARLQQDAEQTTSAMQMMREGVILLSHDGRILLINPSASDLLAVACESKVKGRLLSEIVRIPELAKGIAVAGASDASQELLLEIAVHDLLRPVKVHIAPIASQSETRLLVTLRDETETNQVDKSRREFVANISHELKTPLAAIKGYAETVELAIKDDPTAAMHFMSQIQVQCLRLERLIADMMQLARAQAGRAHLKIQTVELAEVMAESMRSNEPVAEAKHIDLQYEATEVADVLSDREATLTIANNLIGNAIRYTPNGGNVHVSLRDAGRMVAIVVQDDGVGISAGEQKRIFERFYRVQNSRTSRDDGTTAMTEGTGIGLSIVKNLTNALGGEVRLTSHPGKGARFEVLLPKSNSDPSN
ncbi:ATP-binding protein [Rubripirellula reticaptiva]|uniref:histidine kinase n=1 Tax=Rubripirellula reticaptiva TaxID=2528013 RepID=A0A5C6EJU9_9BACT|nr:ATP-binding protein [Rubripirellula reticaptiva]TWU47911.1 Signal-transduction histidine kinase senX3 [Rubripirellula reticaptiva]